MSGVYGIGRLCVHDAGDLADEACENGSGLFELVPKYALSKSRFMPASDTKSYSFKILNLQNPSDSSKKKKAVHRSHALHIKKEIPSDDTVGRTPRLHLRQISKTAKVCLPQANHPLRFEARNRAEPLREAQASQTPSVKYSPSFKDLPEPLIQNQNRMTVSSAPQFESGKLDMYIHPKQDRDELYSNLSC